MLGNAPYLRLLMTGRGGEGSGLQRTDLPPEFHAWSVIIDRHSSKATRDAMLGLVLPRCQASSHGDGSRAEMKQGISS